MPYIQEAIDHCDKEMQKLKDHGSSDNLSKLGEYGEYSFEEQKR